MRPTRARSSACITVQFIMIARQDRGGDRRHEQHFHVRRAQSLSGHLNDPYYYVSDNSWQSGRWYDTLFATLYPMNTNLGGANSPAVNGPYGYYAITVATAAPGRS